MDNRLKFRSRGGISFLEWVSVYNNGEPLCEWEKVWNSHSVQEKKQ